MVAMREKHGHRKAAAKLAHHGTQVAHAHARVDKRHAIAPLYQVAAAANAVRYLPQALAQVCHREDLVHARRTSQNAQSGA